MPTAFDDLVEDLHQDEDLAVPADYRRGGQGPATRLRVIRSVLEPGMGAMGMNLRAREDALVVRLSDAPHIAQGDSFTFDPDTTPTIVTVKEAPERDELGLTATCRLRRA